MDSGLVSDYSRWRHDAVQRASYLDSLYYYYALIGENWGEAPDMTFRYKNILFRYPDEMPYEYAAKYYKNIKKIVK